MKDPLYHVRLLEADMLLKCSGINCCEEIVGVFKSDTYEQLGEVIAQIELDNGWENGLCGSCHAEFEQEQFEERKGWLNENTLDQSPG